MIALSLMYSFMDFAFPNKKYLALGGSLLVLDFPFSGMCLLLEVMQAIVLPCCVYDSIECSCAVVCVVVVSDGPWNALLSLPNGS